MRLVLFVLIFASLPVVSAEDSRGKLIFAVQVLETAHGPSVDGGMSPGNQTGIFYYCRESGPGECEPYTLQGYNLSDGKIVGSVAGDESLLKELKSLPLSSFDVQKEIDSTIVKGRAEAARNGTGFPGWITADGTKYRILYDFNGVRIDHVAWNPALGIKLLAAFSPNLKSLNDLLDLFALDYGRRQLWQ